VSAAKKGLGRGFESLIPTDLLDESFDPTAQQDEKVSELRQLAIETVHPNPDQPRRYFDKDALAELTESVREHGVLQPIIVVPDTHGFQIVAGERRYRAASAAGLVKIPALVRTLTDQLKLELSLIENIQRRDLNAIETATAYLKLRDQFNLSLEETGKRVNKSASAVKNTMRLLQLPKAVQTAIAENRLSEGQARPLIGQDPDVAEAVAERIIAEGWSARRVEQYVANFKNQPVEKDPQADTATLHEARLAPLRDRLQTKVSIRVNGKGAGSLVIAFKDQAELDRIQNLING
jgi:ParB family transcriptional regulator, chromosome partitioning protein